MDHLTFYDQRRDEVYAHEHAWSAPSDHPHYPKLKAFVERYALQDKRCLEIGSGRGLFQDVVADYTGTDVAGSLAPLYHKPYHVCTGGRFPFADASFDVIWSIDTYEHIPELQTALREIVRLLRPGGWLHFAPAWHVSRWAARGITALPYGELGGWGKLAKLAHGVSASSVGRALTLGPVRTWRHLLYLLGARYEEMPYRRLVPNYTRYMGEGSDSDACNGLDPHAAILWFERHGLTCLSHPLHLRALAVRWRALDFQKRLG